MNRWPLRPRQPCTGLAVVAGLGIVLADWCPMPVMPVLVAMACADAVVLVFPRTISCWAFAGLAFFGLHTLRHHESAARKLGEEIATQRVVRARGIVWSEPEAPRLWSRTVTARFLLKLEAVSLDEQTKPANGLISVAWAGPPPAYGDRVELTGAGRKVPSVSNPGEFDFASYLQRRGVFSEIQARFSGDCAVLSHGHGNPAQTFATSAGGWVKRQLERDLEDAPQIAALITSMVLGMKGDTPDEAKELFQRTGTLHLFAVSGLNVAMLGGIVWHLLKPLRIRRGAAVFVILPVLAAYAVVTGLSSSCVRATIMGAFILLAYLVDRPPVLYNSLSGAALAILAWDTNQLFAPGFQFSFALVFTIVWLAQRIQRRLVPIGAPDPFLPQRLWNVRQKVGAHGWNLFAATAGVTLAAWIGSLIFTAGYFHLFSPAAIFANFFAVPLAFCVLGLGLLSLLAGAIWSSAAVLFNNANWFFANVLLFVVEKFALIPGGHVFLELPRFERTPECEIVVLDVGSGGATHLRSEGRDWLIDCGQGVGYEHVVVPYLRSRGVNSLDGLVLTHGDAQHIGGTLSALADFSPRLILDSPVKDRSSTRRSIHRELAARGHGKTVVRRGDVFSLGSAATLRIVFPPAGLQRSSADDKALVLLLECSGIRVLLLSDSGFSTEQWLMKNEPGLQADVVIKGQHAKEVSGTIDFLAQIRPQAVICTRAEFGKSPETLQKWEQSLVPHGIAVFRQDQTGAVRLIVRGGVLNVDAFKGSQTFRSRAR